MVFLYNIALYVGFLVLTPRFVYDAITKGKYAAGFTERLGLVPEFDANGRGVVLLHCVSVGEANAALPLAKKLKERVPQIALVVSTTTQTGQQVARETYAGVADQVVYFPFDFTWSVKRFLRRVQPDVILLTETELWFNFIRLSHQAGVHVAIINGRLSERSFRRYTRIKGLMKRLLGCVDIALMQGNADAQRLMALGAGEAKVKATGNLKFDVDQPGSEGDLTVEFRQRFGIDEQSQLILAASTHSPEEQMLLDAFKKVRGTTSSDRPPRMILVPRHPERFDEVADLIKSCGYTLARRSEPESTDDKTADVMLLDSMGEMRAAYPLAEIVFVGGSLIPHGGQSVFEPAAAGRAIVTGPHTANFDAAVQEFLSREALIQLRDAEVERLATALSDLLSDADRRHALGRNALAVMGANRGAVDRTIEYLTPLITAVR